MTEVHPALTTVSAPAYDVLLERLRQDLQLNAATDLLPGSLFQALIAGVAIPAGTTGKMAAGQKSAYWPAVPIGGSITLSLAAADIGLTAILAGAVFAWPLTTWTGVSVAGTGNVNAGALRTHITNTNSIQDFDANYIAIGY